MTRFASSGGRRRVDDRFARGAADFAQALGARLLFGDAVSGGKRIADRFLDFRFFGVVQFRRLPIPFGLAGALDQLRDGGDGVLDLRVSAHDGLQHRLFGQFARFGFDHQDAVFRSGDNQIKIALRRFRAGRIDDDLPFAPPHSRRRNRAGERDARQFHRRRRADHGRNVGFDFGVERHHRGDNLRFVIIKIRKQRAQGAIDQAASQNFFFAWAAFAAEKSAGDFARGIGFFLIINR